MPRAQPSGRTWERISCHRDTRWWTREQADCVDAALAVAHDLGRHPSLGVVVDAYGAGSYMAACKVKGMVAAEVSDERSAYMTRQHNDARMICLGSKIVGEARPQHRAEFLSARYEGGRHQIRVDMLGKMA